MEPGEEARRDEQRRRLVLHQVRHHLDDGVLDLVGEGEGRAPGDGRRRIPLRRRRLRVQARGLVGPDHVPVREREIEPRRARLDQRAARGEPPASPAARRPRRPAWSGTPPPPARRRGTGPAPLPLRATQAIHGDAPATATPPGDPRSPRAPARGTRRAGARRARRPGRTRRACRPRQAGEGALDEQVPALRSRPRAPRSIAAPRGQRITRERRASQGSMRAEAIARRARARRSPRCGQAATP